MASGNVRGIGILLPCSATYRP